MFPPKRAFFAGLPRDHVYMGPLNLPRGPASCQRGCWSQTPSPEAGQWLCGERVPRQPRGLFDLGSSGGAGRPGSCSGPCRKGSYLPQSPGQLLQVPAIYIQPIMAHKANQHQSVL